MERCADGRFGKLFLIKDAKQFYKSPNSIYLKLHFCCEIHTYRIAGNFCGQIFSRFEGKSEGFNFYDYYFRDLNRPEF